MERITLAREYRVAEWLRDAYMELAQKTPLEFEKLRPEKPYSNPLDRNWEVDSKKWEATFRDWETLTRVSHFQTKVANYIMIYYVGRYHCYECDMDYGVSCNCLCKCRLLAMVDNVFRGELESLRENPEHDTLGHPLLRKLPISYLLSVGYFLSSQQH